MIQVPAEFRPELLSRRGEITAWALSALAFGGWIAQRMLELRVHWSYIFLALFLLFSALAISLTNWVDRRTVLRLELGGLAYQNGLRRVEMAWHRIRQIQAIPGNLGTMIRVTSEDQRYFSFRTLGEVNLRGQIRGRVGFADGDRILAHILEKSGLKRVQPPDESAGTYYARQ